MARKMKNSGVEWIGKIPKDYNVYRLKYLTKKTLDYGANSSGVNYSNYLPRYIRITDISADGKLKTEGALSLEFEDASELENTTGNKATNADGYKVVCENDIVVDIILCWMGAIGRSAYNGVTSPAYDIYVPQNGVASRFYHYYFRTKGFNGDCYRRGKGIMAMRWRTYSEQFRDITVVYPPLEEQLEIANYLDAKCAEIDNLITKKELYLKEIENYKKSLIYEYVTGKKEVSQTY